MGADIHAAVERLVGGRWKFAGPLELGRNYDLFAVMAGVRGEHEPISQARGLPIDVDPTSCSVDGCGVLADECGAGPGYHDLGEHSHSWLTLAELRAFDWESQLYQSGVVPLRDVDAQDVDRAMGYEAYEEWSATPPHPPRGYCQGVSWGQVLDLRTVRPPLEPWHQEDRKRDRAIADRLLADRTSMPEPGLSFLDQTKRPQVAFARVDWTELARERCAQMFAWVTEQTGDPDLVRVVFGFSS